MSEIALIVMVASGIPFVILGRSFFPRRGEPPRRSKPLVVAFFLLGGIMIASALTMLISG